jgi:hypothetical protein
MATESLSQKFELLAEELKKSKVPCKLLLDENQIEIHLGWNYSDSLANRVFDAAESLGLKSHEFDICAESHGGKILQSKLILGGPKRNSL